MNSSPSSTEGVSAHLPYFVRISSVFPNQIPPPDLICSCGSIERMLERMPRGSRISAPAINLLNENPSLVALGKLTHTNPRATHEPAKPRTHKPAQPSPPCTICRQAPMPIISGRTQVPSIYYCRQAPMPMISGRTRVPSIYYCL